jgi:hypothetical protein
MFGCIIESNTNAAGNGRKRADLKELQTKGCRICRGSAEDAEPGASLRGVPFACGERDDACLPVPKGLLWRGRLVEG